MSKPMKNDAPRTDANRGSVVGAGAAGLVRHAAAGAFTPNAGERPSTERSV